jgi:hypothetical protein
MTGIRYQGKSIASIAWDASGVPLFYARKKNTNSPLPDP